MTREQSSRSASAVLVREAVKRIREQEQNMNGYVISQMTMERADFVLKMRECADRIEELTLPLISAIEDSAKLARVRAIIEETPDFGVGASMAVTDWINALHEIKKVLYGEA